MAGVNGVIDMKLLSVIRRWHYRDRLQIREIERRTGLSRNTNRKYLRSDAVEVRFKVPGRPSRLDLFAERAVVSVNVVEIGVELEAATAQGALGGSCRVSLVCAGLSISPMASTPM